MGLLARCLPSREQDMWEGGGMVDEQTFMDKVLDRVDTTRMFLRLFLCLYITASLPLRAAFFPDWYVNLDYVEYAILDAVSTVFFFMEIAGTYRSSSSAKIQPQVSMERTGRSTADSGKSLISSASTLLEEQEANNDFDEVDHKVFSIGFLIELLATLPLEYVAMTYISEDSSEQLVWYLMNRILRISYLPTYFTEITRWLEDRGTMKNPGMHRTWKLFSTMAIAGHWCGCMFFFISKTEAEKGIRFTWPESDVLYSVGDVMLDSSNTTILTSSGDPKYELTYHATMVECYIRSLYWAYITMVTTGFGDIVPLTNSETVWVIISMYIGVVITSCSIANLQLLVTNMDAARTNFQLKMDSLKMYMVYRRLPNHLQNRINSFYDYQWDLLRGADEHEFLQELPKSLQQQVANYMSRDLLKSLPVLRKANNALLNALVDCVEANIYSPNDEILRPGEQLKGVLLVSRGEVEVLKGSQVERKLQRFDRFAEASLFIRTVCENLVKSKTFCEIFLLPSEDFQRVVQAQCDEAHLKQMTETAEKQSKQTNKANKMFGSADDAVPMAGFKKHCQPNSRFRKTWGVIMFFGVIYYIFSISLSVMISVQDLTWTDTALQLSIGYVVDVLFLVDLTFDSTFFMYVEEGLVVFDHERIRENFFNNHSMAREFLAAIPWDLLGLVLGSRYYNVLRVPKMMRIPKLFKYVDGVEKMLVDSRFGMDQAARRVFKLMFLMIAVCHWVGCLWHMCANLSVEVYEDKISPGHWRGTAPQSNWIEADEADSLFDVKHSDLGNFAGYLRSIYWAIVAMSTVGYGDIVPQNILETTFSTICILFGGLVLPAIVGGLAAYMGNLNQASNIHKKKMYKVRTFMRGSYFPQSLMDKVLRYYDYLWSRQGGVDEVEIMSELPGPLQQRVAMCVNGVALNSIPFFESCDEGMQQYLVSMLNPRVFLPHDDIMQYGEVGKEMFMIERGQVIISSFDKKVSYTMLEEGDYFGETCLLGATTRMATVYAVTYCDCFVLSKDDFNEVLSAYLPKERTEITNNVAAAIQNKVNKNSAVNDNFKNLKKCLQRTKFSKIDMETEDQTSAIARIRPDNGFRHLWNFIILIVCVYNSVAVPFRLCFMRDNFTLFYLFDWALDVIFFIDVYLNMTEFSYVHQGELITDRDKVRANYLGPNGNFKADLVTMFPLDLFAVFFLNYPGSLMLCLAITRVPKLMRLTRIMGTASDLTKALEDTNISLTPIQLFKLIAGVMLIAHWAACGLHAIANYHHSHEKCTNLVESNVTISNLSYPEYAEDAFTTDLYTFCDWGRTWIQKQIDDEKLDEFGGSPMERYLRAFNWALPTLVVVVIGDVVPVTSAETLYAFCWMVMGVTINATIIGNVANIVANLETDSSDFVKKADDIKHYMHTHHVSSDLQDRVEHFMTYLWTAHKGATNEWGFVSELPFTLQMAISDHTRLKYIKDCPFFDFCSDEIIKALAMCLNPLMFSMGDVLIQYNDMGQEMFFLEKGSVEVVSGDGKTVFATLMKGAFFGETALFFKQKRSATIKAVEFCEVFQLAKTDLDNELRQREFDLSKMLDIFTAIANSNKRRNAAVASNLEVSKKEGTKLSKIIDAKDAKQTQSRKVRKIFLPNSKFRAIWDMMLTLFTMWFAISILYRIAFTLDEAVDDTMVSLMIDFVIDFIFLVDIFLNYKKFAFIENGVIVSDPELIRKNYLKNWMVFDITSCLPLEIFALTFGKTYVFQLRLIHLIRVLRLPSYFESVDHYLNLWNIRISAALNLLIRMFTYYILVNHWCACMWFIIHRYIERDLEFTWATTDCPSAGDNEKGCMAQWDEASQQHDICSKANGYEINDCYIRSFFLVITTISTVGYGDIYPVTEIETMWECTVVLIGACIFAGIIGSFTAFLSHNDTSGPNAFKLKMQRLQEYMKYRKLPNELQTAILLHHKYRWRKSQILDEKAVMTILPRPLQFDLSFEVVSDVIRAVPILSECTKIMQKRIAHAFTIQTCSPQSIIYEAGDIGWDIYFIGSGLIKISLPKDLSVLDAAGRASSARAKRKADAIGSLYRIGNHFGESCLTSLSGVRQETGEARTLAELYLLNKHDMDSICSYMTVEDRGKFRDGLLARNGNVRHTFDDDEDDEVTQEQLEQDAEVTSPGGRTRKPRSSLDSDSGGTKVGVNPYQQKNIRRKTLGLNAKPRDLVRLRSFSAEASKEAITTNPGKHGGIRKMGSSNKLVIEHGGIGESGELGASGRKSDAREAAQMIQAMAAAGQLDTAGVKEEDSDASDSDSDRDEEGEAEGEGKGKGTGQGGGEK
ncbi:hypothetical protein TrVE_jg3161 [Triparma verrucosa]|uniref:Cyclic nucleotide-binding domain-containing protein n=1 Tax=Triparma verrucosa TaxID=1606542 RepID=A0A9W7BMD2_9STRA|nr:hypothetical protein TrVE_jg3161 [Triparma verrucosa]